MGTPGFGRATGGGAVWSRQLLTMPLVLDFSIRSGHTGPLVRIASVNTPLPVLANAILLNAPGEWGCIDPRQAWARVFATLEDTDTANVSLLSRFEKGSSGTARMPRPCCGGIISGARPDTCGRRMETVVWLNMPKRPWRPVRQPRTGTSCS